MLWNSFALPLETSIARRTRSTCPMAMRSWATKPTAISFGPVLVREQLSPVVLFHAAAALADELLDARLIERCPAPATRRAGYRTSLDDPGFAGMNGSTYIDDVIDLFLQIDAGEIVHHLLALARLRIDARHERAPQLRIHDGPDIGKGHQLGIGRHVSQFGRQPRSQPRDAVIGKVGDQPTRKTDEQHRCGGKDEGAGFVSHGWLI